ncbi:MAG: ComEC/Rec2 family competence protein [Candidatus Ornithomonoglobus sp.]
MRFSPIILAAAMVTAIFCTSAFGTFIPLCALAVFTIIFILRSVLTGTADMVVLALTIGAAAGVITYSISSDSSVHKSVNYIGRYVTYRGVILSSAQESSTSDNYKYTLRVKEINHAGDTIKDNENILLSTPEKFSCGESITVSGIIKELPSQMNENGFDSVKYYKSQNIFTRMYSKDAAPAEKIKIFSPSILCGRFRDAVDNIIYKYYYGNSAAVLSAVLTGNSHRFTKDYQSAVSDTAFKRLFHPAYIHIMLILSFVGLFSAVVPKKLRDIAVMLLIGAYALLNCAQIGFLRCLVTCGLTIYFHFKNGSAYYPDTMAWLVIICAMASPMLVFNAGFVLSVTAGIIIWAFSPSVKRLLMGMPRGLRGTSVSMLICLVFYTPLTAYYFNGICIYSFLLPFIMAPVVLITLVSAPLSLIMIKLFGAAPIIKALLDFMIWIMLKLPPFIASLPFSRITIATPSPTAILAITALLFAAYYYLNNRMAKAGYSMLFSCALGLSVIITALSRIGTTDFIFVSVGQGDGSVIHTAFGATVIVDGGGGTGYSDYNPGESIFVPYLESKGYGTIDAAFISHFHQDHVQGVIAAVEALNVKEVFAPAVTESDDDEMKQWAAELEAAAEENGTEIHYISENTRIKFDKGLIINVYTPDDVIKLSQDDNDTSLLMNISYGNFSALYTGDLTTYGEHEFLRIGANVDADVLKVGHHGSSTSTCPEWVAAVSPIYSVISCGEDNNYGHPTEQTLNNLSGTTVLRTDLNGDIRITADKKGIKKVRIFK